MGKIILKYSRLNIRRAKEDMREQEKQIEYFQPEKDQYRAPDLVDKLAFEIKGILNSNLPQKNKIEQLVHIVMKERTDLVDEIRRLKTKNDFKWEDASLPAYDDDDL